MLLKALRRKKKFWSRPARNGKYLNNNKTNSVGPFFKNQRMKKCNLNYLATYNMYFQFHFMLSKIFQLRHFG